MPCQPWIPSPTNPSVILISLLVGSHQLPEGSRDWVQKQSTDNGQPDGVASACSAEDDLEPQSWDFQGPLETSYPSISSTYSSGSSGWSHLPLPHMSFREVVNFFSTPIPHQLVDRIIPQLPGQNFAAIQEIASRVPDAELQPLLLDAGKSPIDFRKHYDYWLELRDLLWVEMILLEYSTYQSVLPREHPYRRETVLALHKLKLLSQSITCALWYMERVAEANILDLNFKEILSNRHKSYGPDHPFTLIDPYVNPTKLRIYLDLYPGLNEKEYPEPELDVIETECIPLEWLEPYDHDDSEPCTTSCDIAFDL